MRIANIAASGLRDAQTRLEVSSSNVANINTAGFDAARVQSIASEDGGVQTNIETPSVGAELEATASVDFLATSNVDLVTETVSQIQSAAAFTANLSVIRDASELESSLINTIG